MLAWKLGTAAIVTAWFAATVAFADDASMPIVVSSAQAEVAAGEAHGVLADRDEYWLGVIVSRPSPALQAQLKLPKNQGLFVEALQSESPAAKAGVQQYDILLKGNDKTLTDLGDLMQLIHQVKDGKLTMELLRAGKHETVIVTPTKRPEHKLGAAMQGLWIPEGAPVLGGIRKVDPNFTEGRPLQFNIIRPGQILPSGGSTPSIPGGASSSVEVMVHVETKLADGSRVEIHGRGVEPAKVLVTHDKEKWEGTSNNLSKIPEKIRPEIEKLLHIFFDRIQIAKPGGPDGGTGIYFGSAVGPTGILNQHMILPDVEKRLNDLQKQIDELRQSVDALPSNAKKKSVPRPD